MWQLNPFMILSLESLFCDHSSQLLTLRYPNQSSMIICLKQCKGILMMVQMVVWTFVTETEPSRQGPGWKTSTIGHPSLGFRQCGHRVAMNRVRASDRFVLPPTWNTITVLKLWSRHAVRPRAGASTGALFALGSHSMNWYLDERVHGFESRFVAFWVLLTD